MIYLATQIMISLMLAGIVGGAIGWLLQRLKSNRLLSQMRQKITRQQRLVNQAQNDVTMIAEDFDELKHQSRAEIAALRQENNQLPVLNQNLEKSQLLVRQLMQKNEASIRDLKNENATLTQTLKNRKDRESAYTKLQAELVMERRKYHAIATSFGGNKAAGSPTASIGSNSVSPDSSLAEDNPVYSQALENQIPNNPRQITGTQSELDLVADSITDAPGNSWASTRVSNRSIIKSPDYVIDAQAADTTKPIETPASSQSNAATGEQNDTGQTEKLITIVSDDGRVSTTKADSPKSFGQPITDESVASTSAKDASSTKRTPAISFNAVDQHDDLQQIFGIGPVTEQTLNKLGITSYTQLAELKRHDIEKIADALQIFPGRIERDNWVGSARRQLEEVLEDL